MNVKFYLSDFHACGNIRGEIMAREVNAHFPNCLVDCKTSIVLSDFYKTNIMIFQRQFKQETFDKLMFAKERGIKTIYEIDDDMFNTPEGFKKPFDFYSKPEIQNQMAKFMQAADATTTSTKELALSLKKHAPNKPTFVVENAINAERWDKAYMEKITEPKKDTVTIGWLASGSHIIDVPLIRDALEEMLEKHENVRLHFIGWVGFKELKLDKYKDRITIDDWLDISVLPFAMKDFDIGLAPLVENPFNISKSNLKFLQYGVLGVPCVASPLPPYECMKHGIDGMIAAGNTKDSWRDCLNLLITDDNLRTNIGMTARKTVLDKWDIRKNAIQWVRTFEHVLKL